VRNLEAIELGLREALHRDACRLLEQLLNDAELELPGDHSAAGEKCHPARRLEMLTLFGPVVLRRNYYYAAQQAGGRVPLDEALGLLQSYSPGVVRLACRMGARESFEAASAFGGRLRRESLRRGMGRAQTVIVLGDGARWIWELVRVNFPFAIEILDLYHALEHLKRLADLLYGADNPAAKQAWWQWREWVKNSQVSKVIEQAGKRLGKLRGPDRQEAEQEIGYLESNQSRMRYRSYRRAGYFYGSGVVEAGCKTLIGQRLKQSGMRWSQSGAQSVLTLRSALYGQRFESYWDQRNQNDYLRIRVAA